MVRSALSKVAWVGRTASMVFGLALVLALMFGLASAALGANGGNFILGSLNNSATALTRLTGNVNGAAMQVINNNADANDTALTLNVQSGEAPMRVNSAKKVANLNADRIDDREAGSFANGVGGVATNADKLDGKDSGTYLPGDLPAGTTVRGNFYILSWASAGSQEFGQGISFGYRLPSPPTGHYIKAGETVPAGCSGNATNPEAAPGHLCVFEDTASNVTTRDVILGSPQGSGLYIKSAVEGHTYAYGTWAVTAPN